MKLHNIKGFSVLHQRLPSRIASVRAVASCTGSLFEKESDYFGAAHFLEHMFFKTTKHKSCKEIGVALDKIGSHNAETGHDHTKYYVNCRTKKWREAFKMLSELIFDVVFEEEESEKERSVILEEIQMHKDDPMDFFMDEAMTHIYPGTHQIIGTVESVANMTCNHLSNYRKSLYDRSNLLFVIVGDIEEYDLRSYCEEALAFATYAVEEGVKREVPELNFNQEKTDVQHAAEHGVYSLAMPAFTEDESHQHKLVDLVFNHGFGGATSSLMFERLRQDLGLCYAAGSMTQRLAKRALMFAYCLTSPENIDKVEEEVQQILTTVRKEGFPEDKLEVYKQNLLHHVEGLETSSAYASTFLDNWLTHNVHLGPDEVATLIESVTNKDIIEYANFLGSLGSKVTTMNAG